MRIDSQYPTPRLAAKRETNPSPSAYFMASPSRLLCGTTCMDRSRQQYNLCTITGIELFHYMSNVDLDGAFTHIEVIGDQLILLSLPQTPKNLQLARCEALSAKRILGNSW